MTSFACACSDESRVEAESWLREVLPGLGEGEEAVLTGEVRTYTPVDEKQKATGDTEVREIQECRDPDLTESLLLVLEEEGSKRHRNYQVSIGSDMWCGVSVVGEPRDCGTSWSHCKDESHKDGKRENVEYGAQYDYGLLPHALAACVLQIKEEEPVSDDHDHSDLLEWIGAKVEEDSDE